MKIARQIFYLIWQDRSGWSDLKCRLCDVHNFRWSWLLIGTENARQEHRFNCPLGEMWHVHKDAMDGDNRNFNMAPAQVPRTKTGLQRQGWSWAASQERNSVKTTQQTIAGGKCLFCSGLWFSWAVLHIGSQDTVLKIHINYKWGNF